MASIYNRPDDYKLEHAGPQPDVAFLTALAERWRPERIVEYGCGTGRVTIPLAARARIWDGQVTGVDASEDMVSAARGENGAAAVTWAVGSVPDWRPDDPADLIVSACSSLSHLASETEGLAVWRNARASLRPGGRFLVMEQAPDYATLADSMRTPPRAVVQLDGDAHDGDRRLLRCRSARYFADRQRMSVRFFYDRLAEGSDAKDRFVDDYEAHVFFPGELRLLFLAAGFVIEAEWGDYRGGPFVHDSRVMIFCGRVVGNG